MKTIAIILIREGSEGLPNKNIKLFCDKPLCFWTIEQALNSKVFDEIWVSSDSEEYLTLCETEFKDSCNYLFRDKKFALSTTTTYETLEYLFSNEDEDFVFMNLQVTSPLRTVPQIQNALNLFKNSKAHHLVSFAKTDKSKSLYMDKTEDDWLVPSCHGGSYRRQSEPEKWYPTGSIWLSTKTKYLKDKTFYTCHTKLFETSNLHSFEIDDIIDFEVCEFLFSKYFLTKSNEV